jgi:hypothetical protein
MSTQKKYRLQTKPEINSNPGLAALSRPPFGLLPSGVQLRAAKPGLLGVVDIGRCVATAQNYGPEQADCSRDGALGMIVRLTKQEYGAGKHLRKNLFVHNFTVSSIMRQPKSIFPNFRYRFYLTQRAGKF